MPTSYILFGKRRKLWDTRKREHLKLSKSDYHIKQQSVDFSAYMAHIMECEEAQHTQMRNQYMYLYNKNLYIFANKMECGHTYFKHVYRKCVVCNTLEKWTLNWSIDNSCKHFIKHCFKLVESHRRYCFPHLDKQTLTTKYCSILTKVSTFHKMLVNVYHKGEYVSSWTDK